LQTRLPQQIQGASRATVTSFVKMSEYGASLGLYLFIGAIAEFWSFAVALGATAALTVAIAVAFAATARDR
jgi:hypothetical protein